MAYSRTYDRWPSFATFRDRQLIINSDRTFYRYEANTGELIGTVEVTHESEGALLAAADSGGRWVACAWGNCMLDILDFDRTRSWHYALTARAQAVAIGPRDGLTVVTADEQIQVFRPGRKVRNGKLANGARCWHLSVDSSGRYALADANDGVLYEINLGTIDARPRLTGLPSSRVTLAEPDRGQLVRLLAASPGVQVIQYKDIPPTVQLPARSGPVVTLGVSPDGSIGILGLKNRPTEVWNLHHGIEQGTIYAKEPEAIAVNNDIGYVLTASGQWCWVWTLDTRLDRMFRQTRPPVAITSDGLALSVDFDRVIVAWEPTTGRTLRRYTGNTKPVLGLGATSEGAGVISVNRAGQILIWEAEGPPSHSIHVADEPSLTAINADRGLVAVWPDRNGDIALVDISVGAVYRHIPAHLHQATHLTFSGLILVVASGFDEELECWDTSSGRRLAVYPLGSSVQAVAAAADGGILAADLDHNLYWLRVSLPPSTIETPPD